MTQLACPGCRLRFAPAAARLVACPECGRPPQPVSSAKAALGFRLHVIEDMPPELPEAVAVSVPIPDPGTRGR
jgi:hypothetical protein